MIGKKVSVEKFQYYTMIFVENLTTSAVIKGSKQNMRRPHQTMPPEHQDFFLNIKLWMAFMHCRYQYLLDVICNDNILNIIIQLSNRWRM